MHFQPIVEEQMVVLKLSLAHPEYTSLPHTYLGTLLVLGISMPVHGLILVLWKGISMPVHACSSGINN